MSYSLYSALLAVLLASTTAKGQEVPSTISVDELRRSTVIGRTGVPLGKVVVMEVTIVAGDENRKSTRGEYFLEVAAADGVRLPKPVTIAFETQEFLRNRLPEVPFNLYKMNARRDAVPSDEQIRENEKGFVGKPFKLFAYETGYFAGLPYGLPSGTPVPQDHDFTFVTHVTLLGDAATPLD